MRSVDILGIAALAALSGASAGGLVSAAAWAATGFASAGTLGPLMACATLTAVAVGPAWVRPKAPPLKVYAWTQLAFTLAALFSLPLVSLARMIDRSLLPALGAGPARAVAQAVLLLVPLGVPFAALGAGLPQLALTARLRGAAPGRATALVLAAWGAGVAAAVVWSGAWLVAELGVEVAGITAIGLASAGAFVALIAERFGAGEPALTGPEDAPTAPAVAVSGGMTAVAAFVAGLAASAIASSLHRLAGLAVGHTVYLLPLELSAFAVVFALTAAVGGCRAPCARSPWAALCGTLAASGLALLVCLPLDAWLPDATQVLRRWLPGALRGFHAFAWLSFAAVLAPAAVAVGAVWPMLATTARPREEETQLARALSWLAAGGAVGALIGALLMASGLGFRTGLRFGGSLALAAGVALAWRDRAANAWRRKLGFVALAVVALYVGYPPDLGERRVPAGGGRGAMLHAMPSRPARLVWAEEDATALVTVERDQDGHYLLRQDGVAVGSTGPDRRAQKLLAHLPLLMHEGAHRVLLLGRGTGLALTSALAHPVDHVEVVDPSPALARAGALFHDVASFQPARVTERTEEPRAFLAHATGAYDVVLVDQPRAWQSRAAPLWTENGLAALRARLAPGGRVALRLETGDMDTVSFQWLARAVRAIFHEVDVFRVDARELVLVCGQERARRDLEGIARRAAHPAVRQDLEAAGAGLSRPLVLVGHHLAGNRAFQEIGGLGSTATDDEPLSAYLGARTLSNVTEVEFADRNLRAGDPENLLGLAMRTRAPSADELLELVRAVPELANELKLSMLHDAMKREPAHRELLLQVARTLRDLGDTGAAAQLAVSVARADAANPVAWELAHELVFKRESGSASLRQRRPFTESLVTARRWVAAAPATWASHAALGRVYHALDDHARAFQAFATALMWLSTEPQAAHDNLRTLLVLMASSRAGTGDLRAARALVERADRAPGAPPNAPSVERHLRVRLAQEAEAH